MAISFTTLYFVLSIIGSCFALFQLSGIPSTVVIGDNVTMVLTCTVDNEVKYVRWRQTNSSSNLQIQIAEVRSNCNVTTGDDYGIDNGYDYSCGIDKKTYFLRIAVTNLSEEKANLAWICEPLFGNASNKWCPTKVLVPVTNIEITPAGASNVVSIKRNYSLTFTCTTDACRPTARIQWYIGEKNVTNQTSLVITQDGSKFISSSTLNYTGKDADHNKVVYCEAINIDGRQKVKTDKIVLFVRSPVTRIAITPVGIDRVLSITEGDSLAINCTTDSGRPAALIQLYIGGQNVTNQTTPVSFPAGSKFISTSTLNYTMKDTDHGKTIYCEAVNIGESLRIKSAVLTTYINVPVTNSTIVPIGNKNVVHITKGKTQTFTCTTDPGRPAAWIQWYIGELNVTNETTTSTAPIGTKFISTSTLKYTGKESDHDLYVFCEAVSLEGIKKVQSIKIKIYIRFPIELVTITTMESSNNVSVVTGEVYPFTCTTDSGRPAAWIKWYIGGQNETNQATTITSPNGTKFITTSTLNYTGKDSDHNKVVYCDAVNIEKRPKVTSSRKTLSIKVPVSAVTITPAGINDTIYIVIRDSRTFMCKTGSSRPAALIQWFIGKENVTNSANTEIIPDETKFMSSSTLNYTGSDFDHNKTIHCSAVNIEGKPLDSRYKTIYIQLPVKSALIKPAGNNNVISVGLGKIHTFNCTTDASRPAAWIQWYIGEQKVTNQTTSVETPDGSKFISSSTLNYKIKDTDHNKVVYCAAVSTKKNITAKSMNKTLYVIVPVSSVTLSPTFMNNSVTVVSEKDFNFTCKTSASRPVAWIQWYIGGLNVTNRATSVITHDETKFMSSSNLYYTGEIDDHDKSIHCEAVNSHGSTISLNESLYILSRTTNDETYNLQREIFIGTNEGLNLTVYLIANPKPHITWTFDSDQESSKNIVIPAFNITSVDTFRHATTYVKTQAVQSDFGNYTVKADNGIESEFVHVFSVKPAQAPSPPFNVDVVCDQQIPFINVSWFSNFNGGTKQKFYVVVRNMITNVMVKSSAQNDRGQNVIHSYESTFDYDSVYETYVEAHNKHGAANSSDLVNCTTSKAIPQSSGLSSAAIGGVAGSSAALIVVAVIGLVVFLLRRRKNKGDEKQHLHRLNGQTEEVDENEEDGLKDNPLYGTSGMSVSAVEFAHVQKLARGKNPSTVETRDKNQEKKKRKQTERIELACVYENADDLRKDKDNNIYGNVNEDGPSTVVLPSNDRKTKKNKDGLIYADLELASPESGKTFVIRGLENKTNYAIIDLSKKAEPLQSDSDEGDTINTGQGNIDNS